MQRAPDVQTKRADHTKLTLNEICIPIVFAILYATLIGVLFLGDFADEPVKIDVNAKFTSVSTHNPQGQPKP